MHVLLFFFCLVFCWWGSATDEDMVILVWLLQTVFYPPITWELKPRRCLCNDGHVVNSWGWYGMILQPTSRLWGTTWLNLWAKCGQHMMQKSFKTSTRYPKFDIPEVTIPPEKWHWLNWQLWFHISVSEDTEDTYLPPSPTISHYQGQWTHRKSLAEAAESWCCFLKRVAFFGVAKTVV